MVNAAVRVSLVGAWMAVLLGVCLVVEPKLLTTAVVLAIGVVWGGVTASIFSGAPPPTVAEVLHSVQTKEGRP